MTAGSGAPLVLPGATLAEAFGIPLAPRPARPRPRLTPTQTLALTLVADGVPYRQIAARLHLAEGTVRRLMSDAFLVLGVRNKAGAVRAGVESGILDLRGRPDAAKSGRR